MGFFSWVTSDTNESISNAYSNRGAKPCKVLLPFNYGGYIVENEYDGYGIFGGEDIYALVAQWNKPELCNGFTEHDRRIGIDIACGSEDNASLDYPIKIVSIDCILTYDEAKPSADCEFQGFFYYDEEEDYEL